MLTGDVEFPQENQCAHQLKHLITNRVASDAVHDDDLDDKVINVSSHNSPTVGTKWKWITKYVKLSLCLSPKHILPRPTFKAH